MTNAQEIINEIEHEDVCRKLAVAMHEYDNPENKKADVWVCGIKPAPTSKPTNCEECGKTCYYDPDKTVKDNLEKKHKKICVDCIMNIKKYSECLNPIERMIFHQYRRI